MAALSHAQARQIIADAWARVHGRAPTEPELTITQAIALLETGYGRAGQFSAMADQGQFNWGALERRPLADGSCPPGTVSGQDQGDVCFYVFPSDIEAAAQYIRTLTKKHWPVVQAMATGSPEAVATAMRVPPAYYTGTGGSEADRIRAYANAIRGAITRSGNRLPPAATPGLGLTGWLTLGALGAGGWWLYKRYW